MKAAVHPLQAARLVALKSYGILDTPRDADFDGIVELASEICGAPISVVNLIDADRQWFKAEVGLGVRETPLDTSICSHVILESEFVEINDTLQDRRMQDNELCNGDPGLRFYAGALLKTEEGLPLGTLCVLDYRPRTLNDFQRNALRVLAGQVMAQLNLRRALRRQTLLSKEIDHRVKNSLQSAASLVRLQARRVKGAEARAALEAVDQRLGTIALLHDELYHAESFNELDVAHYLTKIRDMVRGTTPDDIGITVDAAPILIDASRASSLGVIVSEFVMNSVKHAFPEGRGGSIKISLREIDGGNLELLCADDGIGRRSAPTEKQQGLGLRLIEASAMQIGGRSEILKTAELKGGRGFGIRIEFPAILA